MAGSSVSIPAAHIVAARRCIVGDNARPLARSSSGGELYKLANLRRSCSDNNLLSSSALLRVSSTRSSKQSSSSPNRLTPARSQLLDVNLETDKTEVDNEKDQKSKKSNWIRRLLELRMRWKGRQEKEVSCEDNERSDECEDGCPVHYQEAEAAIQFDSTSFSRLLVQVPWSDAKRFSKLAFLCAMAYRIADIKGHDLHQDHSLNYVTSSLEKKAEATAAKAKLNEDTSLLQEEYIATLESNSGVLKHNHTIHPSIAYEIAASAASHVQCRAKNENCSRTCVDGVTIEEVSPKPRDCKSGKAAQIAASTMTAVVAAREREKLEIVKELQSLHSSPCEWFICDDPATHVRYFVIQGSETLASWQANLFFEPAKFEETDALVHRGIYEAAKGIYEQFLPQIQNHIDIHGEDAKIQFTGHSLGGSLSLLVHIMLIIRKNVKPSTLLPVVTFGSPFVFCGGDKILEQFGLKESMVQSIILHRDIVPRAFSCNYPRQVAQVLKRLNSSFQSHPCLNKHKMLYSSLGQILILQPGQKLSPSHPFLPSGCGLYSFDSTQGAYAATALRAFLNTPHPLETLSDPTSYGSEGTIIRDHDSKTYLKAVHGVMKQYTKRAFRKVQKERHLLWPLVGPNSQAWTHEGKSENKPDLKKVMSSV